MKSWFGAAPCRRAASVKELIDAAKEEPGKIDFGAPGPGSPIHLAMELFIVQAAGRHSGPNEISCPVYVPDAHLPFRSDYYG